MYVDHILYQGYEKYGLQSILWDPLTLVETFLYLMYYDKGDRTYRTKETKTIEAINEGAATRFLV